MLPRHASGGDLFERWAVTHPFLGGPIVALAPASALWVWFGPLVSVVAWLLLSPTVALVLWGLTRPDDEG